MTARAVPVDTPVLISAYAASPAHTQWDPDLERELLASLCALPEVAGLEIPWIGAAHPHDTEWLHRHLPGAQVSFTPLPWIMRRCAELPTYGLASADEAGRGAALSDLQRLQHDARMLTERSAGQASMIALHTAPRGGGDVDALTRSLDELAAWDWSGARLVIEHCDAVRPGQAFEKGFLALEDEIAAIERSSTPVALWLNWGRSAIELRDPDAVTAQIAQAAGTGHLVGLSFSGAAPADGPYGTAWTDSHPPIRSTDPASGSVLDDEHVAAAIAAAGELSWLGLKVSRRPADRTAAEVTRTVTRNLDVLLRARRGPSGSAGGVTR